MRLKKLSGQTLVGMDGVRLVGAESCGRIGRRHRKSVEERIRLKVPHDVLPGVRTGVRQRNDGFQPNFADDES